jgi:hypothetical protein
MEGGERAEMQGFSYYQV